MMEIKQAKEVINYIANRQLCESYQVFPFPDENEANDDCVQKLLAEYTSFDLLAEHLRRQHREIGTRLQLKSERTPALLKQCGYVIDPANTDTSFFCGREKELLKMHVALHKKLKNNVMLVGSPGTGKTKLVEAFAATHQIHNIYVVECAKLIGSTEYRGAFEQRTVDLLHYVKQFGLTVFFDEIHTLVNLGKSTGGIAITDILKPYLLDEDMLFLGATTPKECLCFAEDEAFKRRFTMIRIQEPTDDELLRIKRSLEENLFGEPMLTESETRTAIDVLRNALPESFFPDKLIDFLDFLYSYKHITQSEIALRQMLDEFVDDHSMVCG